MSEKTETYQFQTEARQLLDLMVHSVYSNKEIFLRELISNASDALDKLRFEAVKNPDLNPFTEDAHIRIEPDAQARTLTIADNGIGMTHDEVIEFIGTIAKSGTKEYLRALKEAKASDMPAEMIGQFGVGFYSSFMVADKVTLVTRHATEHQAWRWESEGQGSFTLDPTERERPGTTIVLHLKEVDEEDGIEDYTKEHVLRRIVRKYSDFVTYPIRMEVEKREYPRDKDGNIKDEAEPTVTRSDETLNSMKAIWRRAESEVSDEEYKEFYRHLSHDWGEPLRRIVYRAEGTSEFRALLFLPERAPLDLFMHDAPHGIDLYIQRVFIMKDCEELIPRYLRFVRGVVDSEDLSLNISRELLQQNRQIRLIHNGIVRKVLDTLGEMHENAADDYAKLWEQFGGVIKEGLLHDQKNREKILDLCLFRSTHADEAWTSLGDYVERMPADQDAIYYMTGESLQALKDSPHLEAFMDKGYEVLLLTEPVDEVWTQAVFQHKDKPLRSVGKGDVELGSEEERKQAEQARQEKSKDFETLLEAMREKLDDRIKEVRLSARLTSSPACLVSDEADMSPHMERLLRGMGQEVPPVKRILEVNAEHPVLQKLQTIGAEKADDPRIGEYAELLYGQAVIAEGGKLPKSADFSKSLADIMARALE